MKQFDAKLKELGGNRFYIRPLPALRCAYMSGEVFSFFAPLLSSALPAVSEMAKSSGESALDLDIAALAPALASGLSSVSGDKLEKVLKLLLVQHGNVAVALGGGGAEELLTEDLLNEVFCCEFVNMLTLALEVIKVNFPDISKKLGSLFGSLRGLLEKTTASASTGS